MSKETNGRSSHGSKDPVPILTADDNLPRLKILEGHFQTKFGKDPTFFTRVPGRVNLIGEHIDYCGYAVCPMAIEQDILIAVSVSDDDDIRLTNVEPQYEDFHCSIRDVSECIRETGQPAWHKYFLCGVKGALEVISGHRDPSGILAAVWGNIPANSGLSSSSALVSAAVLSIMHASQFHMSKEELATISARAERHIGTQGGGMDQAIAFLGKAGSAKLIEFNPLRGTDITLPDSTVFVIAHSLATHNKAATADYNLRVAECRLAAKMIAKKKNKDWEVVQKLIDVQERLEASLDEMVSIVISELHEEPYTIDEICKILDTTYEHLKRTSLVVPFNASQTFKLRQRSLHVFQEASRVEAFRRVNEDKNIMEQEKLLQLGNLMSKSHASLHKLYECSHPRVDALVDRAMNCGALGARLTGAGWGGCVVAIVPKDKVSQFVDTLRNDIIYQNQTENEVDPKKLVFQTEPKEGAIVYII
ncbi:N-acetylgalactosamine kinase isoform X1 [Prorops nasuta]|uniref:N-acetylgalactosamine kinase isoform X1 n=1 Tax=Prorops nasuta TaxID=863751 RepID=UPI0034CE15AA